MTDKDWTGSFHSIFKIMGASNHTDKEREKNDFYATDPAAIDLLLKKISINKQVLEPACGTGCLSERLTERGYDVKSYDLIDRGYGERCNFFDMTEPPFEGAFSIVTNPPYKYAKAFVLHALDLVPEGGYVCMFLKTTFAEGKARYNEIFKIIPPPPQFVLQCVERVLCAKNADFGYMRAHGGSAVAYAWWVWRKGYKGPTILDWI